MKVLFFGDSNTYIFWSDLNWDCSLERHDGLFLSGNQFDFLLECALNDDVYDLLVCCIGHNDWGTGESKHSLQNSYRKLKEDLDIEIIIVGPYADIDTRGLDTYDGIHFTDKSKEIIGDAFEQITNDLYY